MSAAHTHNLDLSAPPVVKTIQTRSLMIGVVFSIIAIIGAFLQPDVFIRGYLISFMAWLGVTLGSMAILMLRHMTGGGWGMVIRRVMGAGMRCIWLMGLLFLPIGFMKSRLYIWARPLDTITDKHLREHLQDITQTYLTSNGFWIRAIIYFAIWFLLIFFLTKWSKEQDQPPVRDTSAKFKVLAGPGLILYGFTISFAAIDWIMSLDPSWISTIYGLLFLAGQCLSAVCFAVIIERILVRYKPMSELLRPDFVHDHGKLMLTFIMVWAYFSFSQWLIIWAGNLPDEISWYLARLRGGWAGVGLFLALFHFCVPFVFLLSRPFKRDVTKLVWLAVWLMFIRWVDILWHVEPAFSNHFTITWADLIIPVAMGGLWMAYFCRNLRSMPLLPAYDLYAREVLEPEHE
ncbi:MAG TPA: hypothetical protein VJQ82_13845 [Terriglobales bacterium]|nr:hypothetical protein [Terriglobales bacterium]